MNKILPLICALSVIGLFGFASFGFALSPSGNAFGATLSEDLGNVTTVVTDMFVAIIPIVVVISVVGGLVAALPKMIKFGK